MKVKGRRRGPEEGNEDASFHHLPCFRSPPFLFPFSGRSRVSYDDLTDDEQRELHATARRFLAGEADVEELPADRQVCSLLHTHSASAFVSSTPLRVQVAAFP